MANYINYGTKANSLDEIMAWHEGESVELEELMGFGFYNHLYICENSEIKFYYDKDEADEFHEQLKQALTDEFFDKICTDYYILISKIDKAMEEQVHDLAVKFWAIQAIFNEIDEVPEIATQHILDRLLKIRTATHTKQYELEAKRTPKKDPKDYIFYKGKIYK